MKEVMYQYPLDWPLDWPKTQSENKVSGNTRYRKKTGRGIMRPWSTSAAGEELANELSRMGATGCIVSSDLAVRKDGQISGNQSSFVNSAVAVYFSLDGNPMVMANDRFFEPANNIRQLTIALQNLRHLSENGGAVMKERAFRGFSALPAPIQMGQDWTSILNIPRPASIDEINAAYRGLARQYHSDKTGGSDEKMAAINVARDEAIKEAQP